MIGLNHISKEEMLLEYLDYINNIEKLKLLLINMLEYDN